MNASNDYDKESISEFYGWECLSLKLPERTVDFVIEN
jgi:hypothetical protein